MNTNLQSKRIFHGLYMVLASPTPIKVLAVFALREKLQVEFRNTVNQAKSLGFDIVVKLADQTIETPVGSRLLFRSVETGDHLHRLQGLEVHKYWVDESLDLNSRLMTFLSSRARL